MQQQADRPVARDIQTEKSASTLSGARMVAKYKSLPLGFERNEHLATHAVPMIEFHAVSYTSGTLLLPNCHVRE